MQKLEHIGIAVKSLSHSIPLFESLLNTNCYKKEEVDSEGVITAFFSIGNQKIELLESMSPDGIIDKFIKKGAKVFTTSHLQSLILRLK